jgi:hypothetical protein
MYKSKLIPMVVCSILFTGCASVSMESPTKNAQAKAFTLPPTDKAGLYIYRDGLFGAALKKDIWVNDECIGESASNVFFYKELPGDKDYSVSTESEFSPNALMVHMEAGKNYFIRQFIKMGLFVGGAGLESVDTDTGKKAITELNLAQNGNCSK